MIPIYRRFSFLMFLITLFGINACSDQDHVEFTNVSSSDNAVMISNSANNSFDSYMDNAQHSIDVGARDGVIPIVAFSKDNEPIYSTYANWSVAYNAHHMPIFETPPYDMQVVFWILKDDIPGVRQQEAVQSIAVANQIYSQEKAGIHVDALAINNYTTVSNAKSHLVFSCKGADLDFLKRDIGYSPGHINVYLTQSVDIGDKSILGGLQSEGAGGTCSCDPTMIGVGELAPSQVVAHEIGHALSLTHFDNVDSQMCSGVQSPPPNFQADSGNLMTPYNIPLLNQAVLANWVLTEGQTFRMNFDARSVKNSVYNDIHFSTQQCDFADNNMNCPSISKRLWADNNLPAN